MGKKIGMAFAKDKGQASTTGTENEDDPNKPPEPYSCIGHFHTDFAELCKRDNMAVTPSVVMRPHRPVTPTPPPAADEKNVKKGGKGKQADVPPPEPEPEPELDINGEPPEPPPKTYITKEKFEYFKPCIQVEMDNPDKQDTVTEIYVRGWKIDVPMMNIFKQCFPKLERLHTINFWNTGLTGEVVEIFASFLPEIANLKHLTLDNNAVKEENWALLLSEESPVQYLSLRYNNITDRGCEALGRALGTATAQNMKLVTLNLNGNKIGDAGAVHLAGGLRMNRNLLSLSLSNNLIGDVGAQKMSEVISRFPLTHEETVARRKLESEKGASDRNKSPTLGSRRADSRDRPASVRSSHGISGGTKGKSAKAGKKGEKEKEPDPKGKGGKGKGAEPDKGTKGKGGSTVSGRSSGASVVADTGKDKKGKDKGGKGKAKGAAPTESEPAETPELVNPLLDAAEHLDNGMIMLSGNRALLNLNLSKNQIGEEGLKSLLLAVSYQTSISQFQTSKTGQNGLMRLCVTKNRVSRDNETLLKLAGVMATKDPFYKAPPASPDQESQQSNDPPTSSKK